MRGRAGAVIVVLAALLAGCGGSSAPEDACARAGFSGGTTAADALFFAVVPRACSRGRPTTCAVADGTSTIDRETVPSGIEQDCVAFSQYVGAGLNQVEGYYTGECFGRARVAVAGRLAARTRLAPRACRRAGGRSPAAGPPQARLVRPGHSAPSIEGRVRDPWGRAPETGATPVRHAPPPWALLLWRGADGSTCYEPGQYVDAHTPGRSDQLPGVASVGRLSRGRLVGPLRYDARSAPGIQLYGLGRFNAYPWREGGSCGDPAGGAGLLLSWEQERARPDLNLGVTTVAGVAGPNVVSVAVGGRSVELTARRAFLVVRRGTVAPNGLPVTVAYRDGHRRTFAA